MSLKPTLKTKSGPPIWVLLDTNVFVSDPALRSPAFAQLKAGLKRLNLKLVVPQIVVDELRNNTRGRIDKALREIKRAVDDLETIPKPLSQRERV